MQWSGLCDVSEKEEEERTAHGPGKRTGLHVSAQDEGNGVTVAE